MTYTEEYRANMRERLLEYAHKLRASGATITPTDYDFEVDTSGAFFMLSALGYQATHKRLYYCVRRAGLRLPGKTGARLAWRLEDVLDFGMELERLRYWLPGYHDGKKTCFELDAEAKSLDVTAEAWNRWLETPVGDLLNAIAEEDDGKKRRSLRAAVRAKEPKATMPEANALLQRLAAEPLAEVRRALADLLLTELEPQPG